MYSVKDLQTYWKKLQCQYFDEVAKKLHFDCYRWDAEETLDVTEALTLGKFIQQKMRIHYCSSNNSKQWKIFQDFLAEFVESENPLLSAMAMIGSMPTKLFDHILWEYNIDFSSPEAFLRRLKNEQYEAIRRNYRDIVAGREPEVLQKKSATLNDFFQTYDWREFKNKGAWQYNLGKLDWGFPLYPGGPDSDVKAPEINPFSAVGKFMSIKDKEKFVVNTLDGKYWKTYKWCRRGILFSSKSLELGDWICPGAWATLLIWVFFWIVSPATFVSLFFLPESTPWWIAIPMVAAGIVTPIWLIIFSVVSIFKKALSHINEEKVERWIEKIPKPILEVLLYTVGGLADFIVAFVEYCNDKRLQLIEWLEEHAQEVAISLLTVIALMVGFGAIQLYRLAINYLSPGFGLVDANLIVLGGCLYLGYKVFGKISGDHFLKFRELPTWLKGWLILDVALIWLHFMTDYGEHIWNFFARDTLSIFMLLLISMLIVSAVLTYGMTKVMDRLSEKQYAKIEKLLLIIVGLTLCLPTVIVIYQYITIGCDVTTMVNIIWYMFACFFGGVVFYKWLNWKLNPSVAKVKTIADDYGFWWQYEMSKNKALLHLSEDELAKLSKKLFDLSSLLFNIKSEIRAYGSRMAKVATPIGINRLDQSVSFWERKLAGGDIDEEWFLKAFKLLSKTNKSVDEIFNIVHKKYVRRKKIRKAVLKVFKIVFFPLWGIALAIGWIFKQITRIREISQFFVFIGHKICPRREKRERIWF